jgi:glycosyltransferase involved in cell wall biosynthesis
VGSLNRRKNLRLAAELWRELEAKLARPPELMVVGNEEEPGIFAEHFAGLRHVHHRPQLSDAELAELLSGARALIAPSCAEGFGLPVLEALAMGVPVLCSDLPAHRESGLGIAEYLDPSNVAPWLGAVLDYIPVESSRRKQQLERLAQAEYPTWSQHFQRVLNVLEAIP